jgi:hypothetical protein
MPFNWFRCPTCGQQKETWKKNPRCNHGQESGFEVAMVKILVPPQTKMMEPRSKDKGVSVMKGLNEILRARAKEHSRLNDHDEFIQEKQNKLLSVSQGWLKQDGTKRKKVDSK